jgi:pimeloyl-ACP methyl ester carboxylesterase
VDAAGRTHYAKSGDLDVAYQVLGEAAHDLVVLPSTLTSIDSIPGEPFLNRFHQRLTSFCRVIRFDHRGTGLSSRVSSTDVLGPRFWAEDVVAVMDAVGSPTATIFASGFGAMIGLVVAAQYPDRVNRLIVVNGAARFSWAEDYPFGVDTSQAAELTTVAMELDAVEHGVDVLAQVAPSVAHLEAFRTWWDLAGNRAATPTMARAVGAATVAGDVRDVLEHITAPTLIVHRRDAAFVPPEHGRFLASRIPQSTYVELSGADTLYWVGDTAELVNEIEEFVTGVRGGAGGDRVMAAILFPTSLNRRSTRPSSATTDGATCLMGMTVRFAISCRASAAVKSTRWATDFWPSSARPVRRSTARRRSLPPLRRWASRFVPASMWVRWRFAVTTLPAWLFTSVRALLRSRLLMRCLSPRLCGRSSRVLGGFFMHVECTNSREPRIGGDCMPSDAHIDNRRVNATKVRLR